MNAHQESFTIIMVNTSSLPTKQTNKQKSTQPNWKYVGENIADVTQMLSFVFDSVENIDGKKRKCWLPAFPLILAMFSKGVCSARVAQW